MAMPNVVETADKLKSLSLKISRILKKHRVQSEGNENNDFIYDKLPSFMTRSLVLISGEVGRCSFSRRFKSLFDLKYKITTKRTLLLNLETLLVIKKDRWYLLA